MCVVRNNVILVCEEAEKKGELCVIVKKNIMYGEIYKIELRNKTVYVKVTDVYDGYVVVEVLKPSVTPDKVIMVFEKAYEGYIFFS